MVDGGNYSIGLVAKMLDLPAHTIRFWTQTFEHIKVTKINGRRYYNNKAVDELKKIKELSHEKGMKIEGIKQMLRYSKIDVSKVEPTTQTEYIANIEQVVKAIDNVIEKLNN